MFTYIISNGNNLKSNSLGSLNISCINEIIVNNDLRQINKIGNSRKCYVLPHAEVNYINVSICEKANGRVAK